MKKLLGLLFVSLAVSCSADLFAGKRKSHKQHQKQQDLVTQAPMAPQAPTVPAEQQPSLLGNAASKVGALYVTALAGLCSGYRVSAQVAKAIKDFVVQHPKLIITLITGVSGAYLAKEYYCRGSVPSCAELCHRQCGETKCLCTTFCHPFKIPGISDGYSGYSVDCPEIGESEMNENFAKWRAEHKVELTAKQEANVARWLAENADNPEISKETVERVAKWLAEHAAKRLTGNADNFTARLTGNADNFTARLSQ